MPVFRALPSLMLRVWKWRENEIWSAHYTAKYERDQALVVWRTVYDQFVNEQVSTVAENQARERYFAARKTVEKTAKAVQSFYGNSPDKLQRGMMAHRPPVKP